MEKKPMKNQLSTIKEINSTNLSEADLRSLFSWPPRSYTCTFCKRDFRSAQALGGHMNVHRRDRARLRQAISNHHPRLNLNTDPNPSLASFNPSNPSFPASAKVHHQPLMKLPPPVSTISTTAPATFSDHLVKWGRADFAQDLMVKTKELMAERRLFELEKMSSMMHGNGRNYQKNPGEGIVKMELDFGLISEVKEDDHLDLELRLGYV